MSEQVKYIKTYGLQRSGTNYLKYLLESNFNCRVLQNICGSKHMRIDDEKRNVKIVTDLKSIDDLIPDFTIHIYKDIFPWIYSYCRHRKITVVDDKLLEELCFTYKDLNDHWKDYCDYSVSYEFILFYIDTFLSFIGFKFSLYKIVEDYVTSCQARMPRAGDEHSSTWIHKYSDMNKRFDLKFYKDKMYMDFFTEDQIDKVIEYFN